MHHEYATASLALVLAFAASSAPRAHAIQDLRGARHEHVYDGPPNLAEWAFIQDRPDGYLGTVKAARVLAVYMKTHLPDREGTFEAGANDAEHLWELANRGMKHLEEHGRLEGTRWNWPLYEPEPITGVPDNIWDERQYPPHFSPTAHDGRVHIGYARSGVLFHRNYKDFLRNAGAGGGIEVGGWDQSAGTGSGISYRAALENILEYYLAEDTHGEVTLPDYAGTPHDLIIWPTDTLTMPRKVAFGGRGQQNGIPTVIIELLEHAHADGIALDPDELRALEKIAIKGTWATLMAARVFDGDGNPGNDEPAYNGVKGDLAYWHGVTNANAVAQGDFNTPVVATFTAGRCEGLAGSVKHLLSVAAYFAKPDTADEPELIAACEEVAFEALETLESTYRMATAVKFSRFNAFSTANSIDGADEGICQGTAFSDPANARYWYDLTGESPGDDGMIRFGQGRGIAGPLWAMMMAAEYDQKWNDDFYSDGELGAAAKALVRGALFTHDVLFPVRDRHGNEGLYCPMKILSDSQASTPEEAASWSLNSCKGPYSAMVYLAVIWDRVLTHDSLFTDGFFQALHPDLSRDAFLTAMESDIAGILSHFHMLRMGIAEDGDTYSFWWNTQNGLPGERRVVLNSLVSPGSLSFGQAGPAIACVEVAELMRAHGRDPSAFEQTAIEILRFLDWAGEVDPQGRLGADGTGTTRWFCHLEQTKNLPGPEGGLPERPRLAKLGRDGGGLVLHWLPNPEPDVVGYHVFRSQAPGGPYTRLNGALVPGLTYSDDSVSSGTAYSYVISAVDGNTNEGSFSNELTASAP
ncbi:MAG: fibronectin type III domain-containing protein [Planctomycetota bacterium]|jgi:hypothetical protein|nr:fibronectin type III domain-containing protein [Planctomycetota bacterium]MDP6989078.1 fibronectin type III domain-containing protein [Planctomycetota bacterium]